MLIIFKFYTPSADLHKPKSPPGEMLPTHLIGMLYSFLRLPELTAFDHRRDVTLKGAWTASFIGNDHNLLKANITEMNRFCAKNPTSHNLNHVLIIQSFGSGKA
ncbi:hypothetical protein P691DRAFT_757389 [Macrolepiota fuliginosa MF-IS2]|uniref:Uncharacterized protein n=1 Tax=Macrolepiota fuliginosa MF-IS2 TaxID=1400762 RepID=A0A9P6C428_9AGAR|nr:hypothetical protein P691DRAFT_757389 [Macrolepiota fuliginosa MF-IS2]